VRDGRALAARRAYGDYAGWWEFPGGKVEPGESWDCALRREIREELCIELADAEPFYDFTYDYPQFTAVLRFWLCVVAPDTDFSCHPDHDELRWLAPNNLYSVNWLPGDDGVLEKLRHTLSGVTE
jgi:8-oxo-dGTP diphosphatase